MSETPENDTRDRDRRNAILALLLLVPAPTIGVLFGLWLAPGSIGQAVWGVSKVWILAFPLLWWLRVDRQRVSFSPVKQGGWGLGWATGLVIFAAILGAYFLLGERLIDPARLQELAEKNDFASKQRYLLLALYLSFVNSITEEYVWRWFVFTKCEKIMNRMTAVFASGLFFTAHHVLALASFFDWGVTALASTGVFIGGVTWSWLYLKYRSIWPAWVSHMLADLGVFAAGWMILFP